MTLAIGHKAPEISLPTDKAPYSSASHKGPSVVFFYPKDMTPGCTNENIDFSSLYDDFSALNCAVIGVSKDSAARHAKFRDKYDLKHILIADEDGTLCNAYGVWQEKKLYGKTYMGIVRSSFLIDGEGIIRHIWPKVAVKGHAQDVLSHLKAL